MVDIYKIAVKPEEAIKKVKRMHHLYSEQPEEYEKVLKYANRNTVSGNRPDSTAQPSEEFIRAKS